MAEYFVRFSLKVTADNPGDAVDGVVDLFTEKGLRDWVYRVDTPPEPGQNTLVGFYDGYGDPVDMDELLAEVPAPVGAIPVDSAHAKHDDLTVSEAQRAAQQGAGAELPGDDVDLHSLAESLNQSSETPTPSIEEQALDGVREHAAQ